MGSDEDHVSDDTDEFDDTDELDPAGTEGTDDDSVSPATAPPQEAAHSGGMQSDPGARAVDRAAVDDDLG